MAVDKQGLEEAAKALYEDDDAWSAAFSWPDLAEGQTSASRYRELASAAISAYLSALPPVDGLEVVSDSETFASWWERKGRFIDPDTSDVPWFDKRESLAESAYTDALSQASSVIAGLNAERDEWKRQEQEKTELAAERISSLEEQNKRLSEALEAAKVWHEAEDKALSKQPPSSGPNGNAWARLQHQEQMREIETSLLPTTEDHNG